MHNSIHSFVSCDGIDFARESVSSLLAMILSRVLVAASLLASAITAAQNLMLSDIPPCPVNPLPLFFPH
jgi:hypothetical protein